MPFLPLDPTAAAAAPATSIGAPRTGYGKSLAVMRAHLQMQLGGRADVTPSMLDEWINDAYIDLATSLKLDELKGSITLSFVAGQPFYSLPASVYSIQTVGMVNTLSMQGGRPLSKIDKASFRDLEVSEGEPTMYFREGQMLVVYPTPDRSYSVSVDFRVMPMRLVEDTDCPILSMDFHRAILLRARSDALDDLQEFDKVPSAENSAVASVRRRNDREAAEDENRVVGSSVPSRLPARFRRNS